MKPWKGSSGCSPDATFRADTFAQTRISETGGSSSQRLDRRECALQGQSLLRHPGSGRAR